jgi:hypothetical protein
MQAGAGARPGNVKERQQRYDDEAAVRHGRDSLAAELPGQVGHRTANTAVKHRSTLAARVKRPFRFSRQVKHAILRPVSVPGQPVGLAGQQFAEAGFFNDGRDRQRRQQNGGRFPGAGERAGQEGGAIGQFAGAPQPFPLWYSSLCAALIMPSGTNFGQRCKILA